LASIQHPNGTEIVPNLQEAPSTEQRRYIHVYSCQRQNLLKIKAAAGIFLNFFSN
jgi:hypothetical protein